MDVTLSNEETAALIHDAEEHGELTEQRAATLIRESLHG
jgi:hypothetical protein